MNAIFDLQQMMAEAMFGYAALQTALTVVVTMVVTWLWCYFSMGAVTQAERAHRQLRKDVLQSLTDLEKTLKDDGQTTRDSMSFQDIQARIQAAINKSMANGVTTEEMASRLESVHAGICKALRMLRRELVDEVEGFMQTLKQDLEGHGLGVSHNHRKDLLDAMDARLDKLADKVRTDINTCVSDSRTDCYWNAKAHHSDGLDSARQIQRGDAGSCQGLRQEQQGAQGDPGRHCMDPTAVRVHRAQDRPSARTAHHPQG